MCSGAGVCDFNRSTNHVKPPGYNGRLLSPIPSPRPPMAPHPRVAGACGCLHNFMEQGPRLVWRSRGNPADRPVPLTKSAGNRRENTGIYRMGN
jgi:hypothetical protein